MEEGALSTGISTVAVHSKAPVTTQLAMLSQRTARNALRHKLILKVSAWGPQPPGPGEACSSGASQMRIGARVFNVSHGERVALTLGSSAAVHGMELHLRRKSWLDALVFSRLLPGCIILSHCCWRGGALLSAVHHRNWQVAGVLPDGQW
jgi:hypothetical protein